MLRFGLAHHWGGYSSTWAHAHGTLAHSVGVRRQSSLPAETAGCTRGTPKAPLYSETGRCVGIHGIVHGDTWNHTRAHGSTRLDSEARGSP